MTSLDPETIAKMLQEEAQRPTRGSGGSRGKTDKTAIRELPVWNQLNHHICSTWCVHRTEGDNPTIPRDEEGNITGTGASCWNPACVDPRNKEPDEEGKFDRGTQIVVEIKGVYMCRYCFLDGWKKED